MTVLGLVALFITGIIALYVGAESLVRGSVNLAKQLGISPIIIGLTIVAFATSAPEFMVSIVAAFKHSRDIAIGNIIGSNIANIGLIIGSAALLQPLTVNRAMVLKQAPILVLSSFLMWFFLHNLVLSSQEGIILLVLMILFMITIIKMAQNDARLRKSLPTNEKTVSKEISPRYPIPIVKFITTRLLHSQSMFLNLVLMVAGFLFLMLGSNWLLSSATTLARLIGISEIIIGITIVAVGTSLPELATSVVSAIHKEADISVGNIVGSNLFNTLLVLGFVGTARPLTVTPQTAFALVPIMIGFTIMFVGVMFWRRAIGRVSAVVFLSAYLIFLVYLYIISV